ncbi:MAG: hypothetical protein OXH47_06785 [Paracoccaceae bacterium]|nr:hypothetical protein [Paracoccaceae bacterium]
MLQTTSGRLTLISTLFPNNVAQKDRLQNLQTKVKKSNGGGVNQLQKVVIQIPYLDLINYPDMDLG